MAHCFFAGVAELADALDLGSSVSRRGGSSPSTRTTLSFTKFCCGSSSVVEHHLAKAGGAGSNPVFRSINFMPCLIKAGVAELEDAQDLKSWGRSPTVPVRVRPSAPVRP